MVFDYANAGAMVRLGFNLSGSSFFEPVGDLTLGAVQYGAVNVSFRL